MGDKGGDEDISCGVRVVRDCDVRGGDWPDWSLRCRLPGVEGEVGALEDRLLKLRHQQ